MLKFGRKVSLGINIKDYEKLRPFSPKYRIQVGSIREKLSKKKFFYRLNKGCFFLYRKYKSYNLFVRSFAENIYASKFLRIKKWYLKKITKRQSVRLKYISLYKNLFSVQKYLGTFYFIRNYLLNFKVVKLFQLKASLRLSKIYKTFGVIRKNRLFVRKKKKVNWKRVFSRKKYYQNSKDFQKILRKERAKARLFKRQNKIKPKSRKLWENPYILKAISREKQQHKFNVFYNKNYQALVKRKMIIEMLRNKTKKCFIRNFWILYYDGFFRRKLKILPSDKKLVKRIFKPISLYELYQFYIFKLFFMKPRLVTNSQFIYSNNYYVICISRSDLNFFFYIVKNYLNYSNIISIPKKESKKELIRDIKLTYKKKAQRRVQRFINRISKLKKRIATLRRKKEFKRYHRFLFKLLHRKKNKILTIKNKINVRQKIKILKMKKNKINVSKNFLKIKNKIKVREKKELFLKIVNRVSKFVILKKKKKDRERRIIKDFNRKRLKKKMEGNLRIRRSYMEKRKNKWERKLIRKIIRNLKKKGKFFSAWTVTVSFMNALKINRKCRRYFRKKKKMERKLRRRFIYNIKKLKMKSIWERRKGIRVGYNLFFNKIFVSYDRFLYSFLVLYLKKLFFHKIFLGVKMRLNDVNFFFTKVFIRNLLMYILNKSNSNKGIDTKISILSKNFIVEKVWDNSKNLRSFRGRFFLGNNKNLILNKFVDKKIRYSLGIKKKKKSKLLLLFKNPSFSQRVINKSKNNYYMFNFYLTKKMLISSKSSKGYLLELLRPYKVWIFFLNYSLNYYIFFKLHYLFINHFFKMIYHKFIKLTKILKLNGFEFCYELIKKNDNTRYELGINPRIFVKTFNRRLKKGFSVQYILRDIKALLNIYYKNKFLKGYYIRVKGRFQRGRRKRTLRHRKGDIAFNSVHLELDSCYGILHSRFGVAGLKIIFAY